MKAKWLCEYWDDNKDCVVRQGCSTWEQVETLRARIRRKFNREISVTMRGR